MLKYLLLVASLFTAADAGAVGRIRNSDISASAGIVYSKLNLSGSIVNADISNSASIANSKLASMLTETHKCRTSATTGEPEDCNATQSASIIGNSVQNWLEMAASPSAPLTGRIYIYAKSDGNVYKMDSNGTEVQLQASSGAAGFATLSGGDSSATYGSFSCQLFTATGSASLSVSTAGPVKFLLVGGGGGGAHGGGGGGGVIDHNVEDVYLAVGSYSVYIGDGGGGRSASGDIRGETGIDSTFAGFTAEGGGGGGAYGATQANGGDGGSGGGGGGGGGSGAGSGGTGTFYKPEVQGYAGAASPGASGGCFTSSGGGGWGAAGSAGSSCSGGAGGTGARSLISGSAVYYGGGGSGGRGSSGGVCSGSVPAGGTGGGGGGADTTAGSANTGGGGSGGCAATGTLGGKGGSGYFVVCARNSGS